MDHILQHSRLRRTNAGLRMEFLRPSAWFVGGGRLLFPAARQHHASLWPCRYRHHSCQEQRRTYRCLGIAQCVDAGLDGGFAIALLLCTEMVELVLHVDRGIYTGFLGVAAGTLQRVKMLKLYIRMLSVNWSSKSFTSGLTHLLLPKEKEEPNRDRQLTR